MWLVKIIGANVLVIIDTEEKRWHVMETYRISEERVFSSRGCRSLRVCKRKLWVVVSMQFSIVLLGRYSRLHGHASLRSADLLRLVRWILTLMGSLKQHLSVKI